MLSEILIVCAIILSYFGIGFVFNKRRMSPFLGLEFLLIGILFSLLDIEKNSFLPILPPFLGAFGLLMGVQVKAKDLKGLSRDFYVKVFSYSLIVFFFLFIVFVSFFSKGEAAVLASIFTLGSYKVMATFIPDRKKEDREKLFFAAFLPFVCILIYFFSNFVNFNPSVTKWFFLLLFLFAVLSRLVFAVFEGESLLVLGLIGIILFFSELAYIKGVSPFLSMFFLGFYLANYCKKGDELFSILISDEKQLYTIFLIFLGFVSGLKFNLPVFKIGFVIFVAVVLVKFLFFLLKKESFVLYLSPGAFGVVLLSDCWLISGHKQGDLILSSSIVVVVLLQVFSMLYLKRVYAGKD
ncbi:hypothetical protein TTHT_2183 [Thermotomaculum hydrothermale]|uniref:Sodium/hydrogen exchanger n=1 Tax=Thermotomaculum hydrothermale TaxID=981385 RepID=A0A7R6PSP5_9BACT|nr:hypothetical protein [Thermotomaculum hydrothermale]BBB33611.1 hypothetical protein TTHT_2183 [Thermotomaculum hydrothermale]